jgi:serine/threonine protein kinase
VIGSPTADDIACVKDDKALVYLQAFEPTPKKHLNEIYPGSSPLILDIIDRTLQFNPNKRLTVQEIIDHPYFSDLRDYDKESIHAEIPATFEFEALPDITMDELRYYFIEQVDEFNVG